MPGQEPNYHNKGEFEQSFLTKLLEPPVDTLRDDYLAERRKALIRTQHMYATLNGLLSATSTQSSAC